MKYFFFFPLLLAFQSGTELGIFLSDVCYFGILLCWPSKYQSLGNVINMRSFAKLNIKISPGAIVKQTANTKNQQTGLLK